MKNKLKNCCGLICFISFIKATIWRICATGITFTIMMIYGLEYNKSLLFALIDTTVKFLSFYIFDICWTISSITVKKIIYNKKNKMIKNNNTNVEIKESIQENNEEKIEEI